jgi:hypothetical protein
MPPAKTLGAYKAAYDDYRAAQVPWSWFPATAPTFPAPRPTPFLLLGDAQGRVIAVIDKAPD